MIWYLVDHNVSSHHCVSPAVVCVVRVEGTPYLCQTDEVGEICVSSGSTGVAYYGLPGMTKNVFEVSVFTLFLHFQVWLSMLLISLSMLFISVTDAGWNLVVKT